MNMNIISNRSRRNSSEEEEKKAEYMLSRLKKLGCTPARSLKGLASTGCISEQLAAQWLVSHIDDPDLDAQTSRNFLVFICPEGEIVTAVQDYWKASQKIYGWDAAHEYPPHITLMPPFEATDQQTLTIHKILADTVNSFTDRQLPQNIPLQLYSNNDPYFIGYVVPSQARSVLEQLTLTLLAQLQKAGVVFSPEILSKRKGIYHLSLAYGYPCNWHNELSKLRDIHLPASVLKADCRWEVRLYSRDSRLCNKDCETYEMKTSRQAAADLCYKSGDHLALIAPCNPPRHGWAEGFNINTGLSGPFSLTAAERVPQYYSWTMHRSILFETSQPASPSSLTSEVSLNFSDDGGGKSLTALNGRTQDKNRQLCIIRHAERMDMCFGRGWINKCFDQRGVYKRLNLNMPSWLPARPYTDFVHDSPLTQMGRLLAREVGRAIASNGVAFTYCYSSPSLRCVQTAYEILQGCGQSDINIRIEAHLFEWLGWYQNQIPKFMTPNELHMAGFNIDIGYKPFSHTSEYNCAETPEKYYERTSKISKKIIDAHKKKGTVTMMVAHAGSLDTCSRPFLGKTPAHPTPSNVKEFASRTGKVPYCGMAFLEEKGKLSSSKWHLIDPPIPPSTILQSSPIDVDWKFAV